MVQRANSEIAFSRTLRFSGGLFFLRFPRGKRANVSVEIRPGIASHGCKQKRRKRKQATQPRKRGQRPLVKIGIRRNRPRLNANKAQANFLRRYSIRGARDIACAKIRRSQRENPGRCTEKLLWLFEKFAEEHFVCLPKSRNHNKDRVIE